MKKSLTLCTYIILLEYHNLSKEAKLSVSGHVLMENRHGLCVERRLEPATGTAEREAAEQMLARHACKGLPPTTVGADKGEHATDCVHTLRDRHIRLHSAQVTDRRTPGLDGPPPATRAMRSASVSGTGSRKILGG